MSHNALINGASHSISAGKSLINGAGYKISAGKTLINGTSKNIGFALPLKWRWNDTLSWPFANTDKISIKFDTNQRFVSDGFSGFYDFDELSFSRVYNTKGGGIILVVWAMVHTLLMRMLIYLKVNIVITNGFTRMALEELLLLSHYLMNG